MKWLMMDEETRAFDEGLRNVTCDNFSVLMGWALCM